MKPILTAVMLVAAAIGTVAASTLIVHLEQWGPLFVLWAAGGAHLTWIVTRERKDVRRPEMKHRRAA